VRHYLLTRSAYAPDLPLEVNRARLAITLGVTARSLVAQTRRDVTWLVLIDETDPLLAERTAALASSGLPLILAPAGDIVRTGIHDQPWGPWARHIDWSEPVLTTRLDDDDAIAPWVLATYRARTDEWMHRRARRRIVWVLPTGWRLWNGKGNRRDDMVSQFSSLYAPAGDHATIMDINHTRARKLAGIQAVSREAGWLWTRHATTRSDDSRASQLDRDKMTPVPAAVKREFDVDWALLDGLR
jgi:hypothetical protein